jgi:serine/threonine protein kinase
MAGLQDYTRLQKLGVGSFASAHLMQHKVTGKKSVLKRIACKHLKAANAALLEVKVLLSCNHVNITAYHDFFLDSDSDENIVICLLMEFCSGGDLWERIAAAQRERKVLPVAQSAGWLLQIIAALRYLHSCGIMHRDVKPENIFITEEDAVVKLGDFGLAKDGNEGPSNATTQCGTPDYMAPEVLEGRPYEAAADIFSLGAVLYALITSRFPKMLALHVSQGKPLEWPPDQGSGGAEQSQARQLAERMLQLVPAKRGDLDLLAARAAALPGAELLP